MKTLLVVALFTITACTSPSGTGTFKLSEDGYMPPPAHQEMMDREGIECCWRCDDEE